MLPNSLNTLAAYYYPVSAMSTSCCCHRKELPEINNVSLRLHNSIFLTLTTLHGLVITTGGHGFRTVGLGPNVTTRVKQHGE